MIEGYIGVPGAGKTLSMTMRAFKVRKQYDQIISNYGLNFGDTGADVHYIKTAEDLLEVAELALRRENTVKRLMLLDEVHLFFDARMWSKVPAEFLRFLAQPRKAQLDMLYTAQHESQVEKRLRVVTNYLHLCRSWGSDFNFRSDTPLVFWSSCFESFQFRQRGAVDYGRRVYRFKPKYGQLYDTMEVLDRVDLSELVHAGKATSVSPPEVG
jgi:hypothetical protein